MRKSQRGFMLIELPAARKGFTLIELLVVIAVIVLLVSILVPTLQRARRIARQVVCAANLHAYGRAIISYALENADRLPDQRGGDTETFWVDAPHTRALLEPYGLSTGMAFCADWYCEEDPVANYQSGGHAKWGYSYFPYHHCRGRAGADLLWGLWTPEKLTDDLIFWSSDPWVLIADINTGHNAAAWTPFRPWRYRHGNHPDFSRPEGYDMYTGVQRYLSYGLNNCYVDGHVEWIDFDELDLDKWWVHSHWKFNFHWR